MRRTALTSSIVTILLLGGVQTGPAAAQEVVLDEGRYVLFLDGQEAGAEAFAIRRIGGGGDAKILASATVELDQGTSVLAMRPALQTTAERSPLRYQNKISGEAVSEIDIAATDRRFVAMIKSAAGERGREMRATPGAVFLEGTVAHQYYFLPDAPAAGASVDIPVVVPRTGDQVQGRLTTVGTETLRIAGRQVETTRLRLTVEGEDREIWRDDEGRVLRLVIAALDFRAERAEL